MKKLVAMVILIMLVCSAMLTPSASEYVWIVEPEYDHIGLPGSTKAPFFTFMKGDKSGYIDGNGQEVFGVFSGDMAGAAFYSYSDGNHYAILQENGMLTVLSADGKKVSGEDAVKLLSGVSIIPEEELNESVLKKAEGAFDKKKTVTYTNADGQQFVIEALNAGDYHSGVAVVETEKGKFAILDETGNLIPQDIKLNLTGFYYEDLCVAEKGGKYGLVKLSAPHCISVRLNSKKVYFDQLPVIDNDRTLVPVRAIFEALGAEVTWDGITRTVTAIKDGKTVSLVIDDVNATVNGETEVLDVPAKIIGDRTMVPVRFIAQSFGAEVSWDAPGRTVVITTN